MPTLEVEEIPQRAGQEFKDTRNFHPLPGQQSELKDRYILEYCGYDGMKLGHAIALVTQFSTTDVPQHVEDSIVFLIKAHVRNLATLQCSFSNETYRLRHFCAHPNPRIASAAREGVRELTQSCRFVRKQASVEWLDGDSAICRFEHPQSQLYGMVEREFRRSELPNGAEAGDTFDLAIEVDSKGRPLIYEPRLDSLVKRVPDALEGQRPILPKNLADADAIQDYERRLAVYLEREFAQDLRFPET